MRPIDRTTLRNVAVEFAERIDAIGLSFPSGLGGALGLLEKHLSPGAAQRLRKSSGVPRSGDPWETISVLESERLLPILQDEAPEVGAILLSKLPVKKAAELLEMLPGDRARRLSVAIRQTSVVGPETVRRIGHSLAEQLDAQPDQAFDITPVERVGAILNSSRAATRDEMLSALDDDDKVFADQVRKSIFTFANLPNRLSPGDVPKAIRAIEQDVLLVALAGAAGVYDATAEFILGNMSRRMADSLRDEINEKGKVKPSDAEDAMAEVISVIRGLADQGEILLVSEDEESTEDA
jgi:flagellar motor switch protein FliG